MLTVCKATRDIDLATAAVFEAHLHQAIDNSDEAFVSVDCSDVTFMDSAAYHALVNATHYAARHGHTLVIRNLSPACARLIQICDSARDLRVDPSRPRIRVGGPGAARRAC
jgi:anti-anti-sigma factor